jgi:hypothetical protein
MPFEINEIGVRMRILGEGSATNDAASAEDHAAQGQVDDKLVEACVRRVLQVLKAAQER